jgi:hypothetical protein
LLDENFFTEKAVRGPALNGLLLTFDPNPHIMIGPQMIDWRALR